VKTVSILFALAALIVGLIAALYCRASSTVPIDRWGRDEDPGPVLTADALTKRNTLWLAGMFEARAGSGNLHRALSGVSA
jgi:hypothetical protein